MVEGGPELVHLLLADAFSIPGQDLVLHFIDGPGNGGEQLLPAHTDMLREEQVRAGGQEPLYHNLWARALLSPGLPIMGLTYTYVCGRGTNAKMLVSYTTL